MVIVSMTVNPLSSKSPDVSVGEGKEGDGVAMVTPASEILSSKPHKKLVPGQGCRTIDK